MEDAKRRRESGGCAGAGACACEQLQSRAGPACPGFPLLHQPELHLRASVEPAVSGSSRKSSLSNEKRFSIGSQTPGNTPSPLRIRQQAPSKQQMLVSESKGVQSVSVTRALIETDAWMDWGLLHRDPNWLRDKLV